MHVPYVRHVAKQKDTQLQKEVSMQAVYLGVLLGSSPLKGKEREQV